MSQSIEILPERGVETSGGSWEQRLPDWAGTERWCNGLEGFREATGLQAVPRRRQEKNCRWLQDEQQVPRGSKRKVKDGTELRWIKCSCDKKFHSGHFQVEWETCQREMF